MKKLLFIFALLIQTGFAFATDNKAVVARYENVKMYQQPGTSTTIVKALKSTDELTIVRKYNQFWTIVLVGDQAGYVLTSELAVPKVAKPAHTLAKK
jgi:hypothetical protein